MVDTVSRQAAIEAPGLRVSLDLTSHVASLRYFDPEGSFAATVRSVVGVGLPGVLQSVRVPTTSDDGGCILAWRSPTETLVLDTDAKRFSNLKVALAVARDGCIVDQSGGLWVLRASGGRVSDLLTRLGGSTSVPNIGAARRGRLADVSVLALCVEPDETLLVVDRVYSQHLLAWIRQTAADFEIP
jgi:heterotetrameric sarcosine oxidase gamma subunit